MSLRGSIPIQHPPDTTQDRTLTCGGTTGRRCIRQDTVGKAGKGQALQPNSAMAGESRQEKTLATEEHALHVTGAFDVIADALGEGHEATGIHTQGFTAHLFLMMVPPA